MNVNLTLSYPWWFLLLVVILGLAYAALLYWGNRKQKFRLPWRVLLFIGRFLVVSLLAFLLLSPFLKSNKRNIEKPVIAIGIDNSASLILGKDSSYQQKAFIENIDFLKNTLGEKYKVDGFLFGEEVVKADQPDYKDQVTDYAGFFSEVRENYAGMNLGAIILAGDGINNRGIDPEFAAAEISVPVYSIALGDTLQGRDLKISDLRYNSIVYLDDIFPLEVNISATGFKGKQVSVEVYAFGKFIERRKINVLNDNFNRSLNFKIKASSGGNQRLTVRLVSDESEMNKENNNRNIFINVLDNRQKILILAHAPHPDIMAIKASLQQNRNYEVEVQYVSSQKGDVNSFDLVILHQLPSKTQPAQQLINELKAANKAILYIVGKQSNIARFGRQFDGFDLKSPINTFEEAQLTFNNTFTLFSFSKDLATQLESLPPLIVPFGSYQSTLHANVFGHQRINRLETDIPLVIFYDEGERHSGAILGEGLWLWRMHSNLQFDNTKGFDTFIMKTCQFLMARKDKRFFRVLTEGEYGSNEKVMLHAELYNPAFELVNDAEVSLRLTNESREQFNFIFSPNNNAYTLDLDELPVGIYSYEGRTSYGNKDYTDGGEFVVIGQSLESRQLNADHGMLYRISRNTGGQMFYPEQFNQLGDILNNRDDLQNKIYYEEKITGLQNLYWVIGLILLLLSGEWFLRKYLGGY